MRDYDFIILQGRGSFNVQFLPVREAAFRLIQHHCLQQSIVTVVLYSSLLLNSVSDSVSVSAEHLGRPRGGRWPPA